MKKTAGIILALTALMVCTGCPREPESTKTEITVDANTPFNPVFADIEKEDYIPYKSVSEFQFEETDYTYNGSTVYRLKGTYIFKAGDNYWLDGNYTASVLEWQVGSMKWAANTYTYEDDSGYSYKNTGIDFSNHVFTTATDADWITYENELYLKYSVKLNDEYTWKFITKDGDTIYFFFENKNDINAVCIEFYVLNPYSSEAIPGSGTSGGPDKTYVQFLDYYETENKAKKGNYPFRDRFSSEFYRQ